MSRLPHSLQSSESIARSPSMPALSLRSRLFAVLFVVAVVIAAGCAPVLRVPVRKPAEFRVPATVKTIAIMEFEVNVKAGLVQAVTESFGLAPTIQRKVTEKTIAQDHFTVVERERIAEVLAELEFQYQDFANQEKAVAFGEQLGAGALIYGSVDMIPNLEVGTVQRQRRNAQGQWVKVDVPVERRAVTVNGTIKMVSTETGAIIGQKSGKWAATDMKEGNAIANIASWPALTEQAAERCSIALMRAITPNTQMETRKLAGGSGRWSKNFDQAYKFVENQLWTEAQEQYTAVIDQTRSVSTPEATESRAAAHHNVGVLYEIYGDVYEAQKQYKEAVDLRPGNGMFLDSLQTINRRVKEYEALMAQGGDDPDVE
jgi:hypothetical protein